MPDNEFYLVVKSYNHSVNAIVHAFWQMTNLGNMVFLDTKILYDYENHYVTITDDIDRLERAETERNKLIRLYEFQRQDEIPNIFHFKEKEY